MNLGTPTPILRILDEAKAREFYCGFLGFTVDWEHRFAENSPIYMQLSQGACRLHLSEHYGDGVPGTYVRIEAPNLDEWAAALRAKAYKYSNPGVETMPWGSRETPISDPFGNRLIFFKDAPPAAS